MKQVSVRFLAILGLTLVLPLQTYAKTQLWVYTSMYKEFAAPIKEAFEKKNPDIEVQIFQAGSEKIQAKVEAELLAGKPQADVLIASDPFWAAALQKRGLIHTPVEGKDIDTNYYSLMVLICHKNLPQNQRPSGFQDLTKAEFKNMLQTGSPLESGTAFSMVAYLSNKYGWEYFQKLGQNNLASNGGNSTVMQKVESGEKKLGIVLLENVLAAQKRGSPIEIIYPSDGAIPIPSVRTILKSSPNKAAAELFSKFILSKEGQKLLLNGFMYSVLKDLPPPDGAKPLGEVTRNSTPWTPQLIGSIGSNTKDIKKKFAQFVLE